MRAAKQRAFRFLVEPHTRWLCSGKESTARTPRACRVVLVSRTTSGCGEHKNLSVNAPPTGRPDLLASETYLSFFVPIG